MKFKDLPKEIQEKMIERRYEQKGDRDTTLFEKNVEYGFIWRYTSEGHNFWEKVIRKLDFNTFWAKYPPMPKDVVEHIGKWMIVKIGEYYKRRYVIFKQYGKYAIVANQCEEKNLAYASEIFWVDEAYEKVKISKAEIANQYNIPVELLEIVD